MTGIPTITIDQIPDPLPEGTVLLDVREADEWAHGHIDGALHIPLGLIPVRLEELPADTRLLVICKVGGRSAQATGYLNHHGFEAINVDGGMLAWAAAGRPMQSDVGEPFVG